MYTKFYNLKEKPFTVTPDPRFLYLTPSHREALASLIYGIRERMGIVCLLGELKMEFDFVIFDSAPILPYSDTLVLVSKLDGVILIVKAEETRWEVAQKAKEELEKSGAHILGAILNERHYRIPEFVYKRL